MALNQLGIERMTFHSLRHLSASLLLKAGVNPKVVQERLGHGTISITLDTYSHVLPGLQEEAAEKMNNFCASIFFLPFRSFDFLFLSLVVRMLDKHCHSHHPVF